MGRSSNRKQASKLLANTLEEGKLVVSFTFDGRIYQRQHSLTAFEIKKMKEHLNLVGDQAANEMVWKMAIKCAGVFGENVLAQSALDYLKVHKIPKEGHGQQVEESAPKPTVFDAPSPMAEEVFDNGEDSEHV